MAARHFSVFIHSVCDFFVCWIHESTLVLFRKKSCFSFSTVSAWKSLDFNINFSRKKGKSTIGNSTDNFLFPFHVFFSFTRRKKQISTNWPFVALVRAFNYLNACAQYTINHLTGHIKTRRNVKYQFWKWFIVVIFVFGSSSHLIDHLCVVRV